ncbi:MAG: hypothetical protein R3F07_18910 [Opitutaceae bacterium]
MKGDEDASLVINAALMEIQEVRYSLPELLKELESERTSSVFSKEILDQTEISKIFTQKKRAREKHKDS